MVQAESGEIADDVRVALGETALIEPLGDRQGELVESASLVLERTARAGAEERVTPTGREQRGKRVRIDVGGKAIGEAGEVSVSVEPVGGADGDDQVGKAELATKPGDMESQRAQPRRRRSTVPDPLQERFGIDCGARLQGEQGEQGASQRRARRVDHTVVIDHIDRPEQADCWHRHPFRRSGLRRYQNVNDHCLGSIRRSGDRRGHCVGEAGSVQQG